MKILLAPDSFKGSLDAPAVCHVMQQAIHELLPDAQVIAMPMSDGGEGFTEVLAHNRNGRLVTCDAVDPLGRSIQAAYAVLASGEVALDVASASGLQHLQASELDPMVATSRGTGQLMAAALEAGHRELVIGLGGSATNDAGAGMLSALGIKLLDAASRPIQAGACGLRQLEHIDCSGAMPALGQARITVASDVRNPLLGSDGASRVFGPQKGARPDQLETLELALRRFADVAEQATGRAVRDLPGSGAAGGIGAALMAFAGAQFRPGFDVVAEITGLESCLEEMRPDLVITGEGRLDTQTLQGKLPQGVARLARAHHTPVVAIAGLVELPNEAVRTMEFMDVYALGTVDEDRPRLLAQARSRLYAVTQKAVQQFMGR